MKVQTISANNYQPNFGKIYTPKGTYFSEGQQKVVDETIKTLRTPYEAYNNKTPEQYWENRGLDFQIKGYDRDTISLEGLIGAKERGTGVDKHLVTNAAGGSFGIGVYDEKNPFELEDVNKGLKELRSRQFAFIIPACIAILGFILVLLGGKIGSSTQQTVKPLIENIDSVGKKAQEILPDTTKYL